MYINQGLNLCFDLFFFSVCGLGGGSAGPITAPPPRLSAYRIYMRGTHLKPHCLLNPGRVWSSAPSLRLSLHRLVCLPSVLWIRPPAQANAADCPSGERFLSVPGWLWGGGTRGPTPARLWALTLALLGVCLSVCSLLRLLAARPPLPGGFCTL